MEILIAATGVIITAPLKVLDACPPLPGQPGQTFFNRCFPPSNGHFANTSQLRPPNRRYTLTDGHTQQNYSIVL